MKRIYKNQNEIHKNKILGKKSGQTQEFHTGTQTFGAPKVNGKSALSIKIFHVSPIQYNAYIYYVK